MKLYGYYRSSASYRVRIVLNVKSLEWDNVPVLLNRGEQQSEAFKRLNPMKSVPVLDATVAMLSQSAAIAEYLEERYPSPALLPSDPLQRAQVREMQNLIGCDIHPLQNLRVLQHLRAELGQDDDGVLAWCQRWISNGLEAFESLADKRSTHGRFSFGDSLTLADVWLIPQLYNARRFEVNLQSFPRVSAIGQYCLTLEPVAAAHPDKQPDAPRL